MVTPELARRDLCFPRNDDNTAALVLERLSDGVELRLNLRNLGVELLAAIFGFVVRFFGFRVELLVLRTLFYFSFGFTGVFANALEVSNIAFREFALRGPPRPLGEGLVPQSPHGRNHEQERTDQNNGARRPCDNRIALRFALFFD